MKNHVCSYALELFDMLPPEKVLQDVKYITVKLNFDLEVLELVWAFCFLAT